MFGWWCSGREVRSNQRQPNCLLNRPSHFFSWSLQRSWSDLLLMSPFHSICCLCSPFIWRGNHGDQERMLTRESVLGSFDSFHCQYQCLPSFSVFLLEENSCIEKEISILSVCTSFFCGQFSFFLTSSKTCVSLFKSDFSSLAREDNSDKGSYRKGTGKPLSERESSSQ